MWLLKSRQMHLIASHCTVKITEPNKYQSSCSRPLSTNVLMRNLNEKWKNDTMEQHSNIAIIDDFDFRTFLNDCVWNKMEDFGFNVVLKRRSQNAVNVNLECFHILMEAYAKNGNFEKISQIYDMLREDGIAPVPQTYVFLLECLARLKSTDDTLNLVKEMIEDATKNVSNRILNWCSVHESYSFSL